MGFPVPVEYPVLSLDLLALIDTRIPRIYPAILSRWNMPFGTRDLNVN
jgi:hypothetical protein